MVAVGDGVDHRWHGRAGRARCPLGGGPRGGTSGAGQPPRPRRTRRRHLREELEARGAAVTVVACDLADRADLEATIARVEAGGDEDPFIFPHVAGSTQSSPLYDKSQPIKAAEATNPKYRRDGPREFQCDRHIPEQASQQTTAVHRESGNKIDDE